MTDQTLKSDVDWLRQKLAKSKMRSNAMRERERQKAEAIQAELDAMGPKSLEVMLYSRSIRDKIRGAKCGYSMGGMKTS